MDPFLAKDIDQSDSHEHGIPVPAVAEPRCKYQVEGKQAHTEKISISNP